MINIATALLLIAYPVSAFAYINPEIGSSLYQIMIGGILAVGAGWRLFGTRIKEILRKLF